MLEWNRKKKQNCLLFQLFERHCTSTLTCVRYFVVSIYTPIACCSMFCCLPQTPTMHQNAQLHIIKCIYINAYVERESSFFYSNPERSKQKPTINAIINHLYAIQIDLHSKNHFFFCRWPSYSTLNSGFKFLSLEFSTSNWNYFSCLFTTPFNVHSAVISAILTSFHCCCSCFVCDLFFIGARINTLAKCICIHNSRFVGNVRSIFFLFFFFSSLIQRSISIQNMNWTSAFILLWPRPNEELMM